jgi:hypothetical protein
MARSLDRHQARVAEIGRLGKNLARRATRRCEWCEDRDELRTFDAAPNSEPTLETLALLCARCREVAGGRSDDPRTLRFLEGAVWSEVPAVRDPAIAVVKTLDCAWAREALETLGLI